MVSWAGFLLVLISLASLVTTVTPPRANIQVFQRYMRLYRNCDLANSQKVLLLGDKDCRLRCKRDDLIVIAEQVLCPSYDLILPVLRDPKARALFCECKQGGSFFSCRLDSNGGFRGCRTLDKSVASLPRISNSKLNKTTTSNVRMSWQGIWISGPKLRSWR